MTLDKISIFIFHRDLRIYDNIGLINAVKNSDKVIPIFIFTPEQIIKRKNKYFSSNSVQFMIESLKSLDTELVDKFSSKLHYFYGDNVSILNKISKKINYSAVYYNQDYTPYAIKRDNKIRNWCQKKNIECIECTDYLFAPIGTFLKADGTAYEKYTPFKNNAKNIVRNGTRSSKESLISKPISIKFSSNNNILCKITGFVKENAKVLKRIEKMYKYNSEILVNGGRENGLQKLSKIKDFTKYGSERNLLKKSTTELSAYIKFGCISIREVYHKIVGLFGVNHVLIDQLYWREFYYYIAYYFPRVLNGKSLKEKYNKIVWRNNKKMFEAWKNGVTGFPVVDAGMRELAATGYMHNRARLITSGVLIKILNIDWRWGERYYATKLTDYDPAVNNGNWQWGSGSGVDSQPYFRIFNPWTQAKDYDPECSYIKKWIPELKDVPIYDILNWDKCWNKKEWIGSGYNGPIVDYVKERINIIKTYKKFI